jgi:biopolymer transport protein ExbB/TolQ
VVAAGISEALYATAAGIFVAVTAALIYNYLISTETHC